MADEKILVVEDEGIVARDIEGRLKGMGYDVPAIASSGPQAVSKAMEFNPDLVLMDIVLRGHMDGVEAAQQIRDRLDIPVVYLTAYADDQTLQRAKNTGPVGYILKPFEDRELRTTIEIALYKHEIEKRLKESRQWFATTLASIGDAVIATDKRGLINFMNPVAEALTGWPQEDALSRHVTEVFNIINETTGGPAESPVTRALQEGIVVGVGNHTVLIARDGASMPIMDSAAPIIDDKGNISGMVLVFQDVSKRKEMEDALRESNRRLEETLAELKAAQEQMVRQERLRALGQLASGIAHDFNNALSPILGSSDLLLDRPENLDDKQKVTRYLKVINDAAKTATEVVNRLRDFCREDEEKKENFAPVGLNQVVAQAITLSQLKWKDNAQVQGDKIQIETQLQNIPDISSNEYDLREMLTNLISNAVEAMPDGGSITIRTRLYTAPTLQQIVLEVSDTGTGMTEEVRRHCLEPFFTTKADRGTRGTGLGLATVYGIVRAHRGTIDIQSELGKGTTFIIRFPVESR